MPDSGTKTRGWGKPKTDREQKANCDMQSCVYTAVLKDMHLKQALFQNEQTFFFIYPEQFWPRKLVPLEYNPCSVGVCQNTCACFFLEANLISCLISSIHLWFEEVVVSLDLW